MKLKQTGLIALIALAMANPVVADEVNSEAVTTFEQGSTLSSSAMSTTIGALVTAINDNAERIAAMEEPMAGGTDVSGKSCCMISIGTGMFAPSIPAEIDIKGTPETPFEDIDDNGVFGGNVF